MNLSAGAMPADSSREVMRARRHRLLLGLVHGIWIAVIVVDIAVFVLGAILSNRVLHQPCPSRNVPASACAAGQLTHAEMRYLSHLGLSLDVYVAITLAVTLLGSVVVLAMGALIAWRKWNEGVGLLASAILISLGANGTGAIFSSVVQQVIPSRAPLLSSVLLALGIPIFVLQWPALGALLLSFPTGHFAPRWTWLLVGLFFTQLVAYALFLPSPFILASGVIAYGAVAWVQAYRYRRFYGLIERQQAKWLIYMLAVQVFLDGVEVGAAVVLPNPSTSAVSSIIVVLVGTVAGAATFLFFGLAIAIALLRYRLYDIDLIINRTLVYGGLTVLVVGGYVLTVGYLGAVFQARGNLALSLIAAGVVAVLFQPAREYLQQGANRLLYGDRDDPYAAIARLGRQLEGALAPDSILPAVATTIRESLRLPFAAISLAEEEGMAAVSGMPRGEVVRMPLVHAGTVAGELLLCRRAPGEGWTPAEQRLLDDLAHSAGGAVQAVRLTRELQQSRERLVLAREEERRRLRRDLHDELAPSLAALALTASTALDLLPAEAGRARSLIAALQQALRDSVGEVRRLAYDLRPPTLDELGLVAAIRERASQVTVAGESRPLQVTVDAPAALPPLPAAAEVAAYRIVQEALMNVLRHAQAQHCSIRLAMTEDTEPALEVRVEDDGVGLPDREDGRTPGVGLRSMQERAAELGGTCSIERAAARGTRVQALLPIASTPSAPSAQSEGAG